jgi:nitrogen fixation NifU-like protein
MYTKETLKHFTNPKNFGKIKDPDGVGKVGNVICGDVMWLYIKLKKNKKQEAIIKDIKFETFGCVAAIATSSEITELAKGKTLAEALRLGKNDIIDALGGLPEVKIHCSVLAIDALAEAIYDYLIKNKMPITEDLQKRHEVIQKHKDVIEEKYHDWTEMEEKLSKK